MPLAVAEVAAVRGVGDAAAGAVRVRDLGQHAAWIQEYVDLGFEEVYIHHVGKEQRGFLDAFGEHVLPQLDVDVPAPAVAVAG